MPFLPPNQQRQRTEGQALSRYFTNNFSIIAGKFQNRVGECNTRPEPGSHRVPAAALVIWDGCVIPEMELGHIL